MPPELFIFALIMDLALGEPRNVPHPVQAMGFAVAKAEGLLRPLSGGPAGERLTGALMALAVPAAAFLVTLALTGLAYSYLGPVGGGIVTVYLAYTAISARGLADAAMSVRRPLVAGDMEAARRELSMIVGRDTAGLGAGEVARGAVETVSENASDGVVAPLFYLAIGGPPLAMAYKAVNTMDSMVGSKTERHRDFGWAAAKLDDLANFIPARLTAIFMVAAAAVLSAARPCRFSASGAWRVLLRDRKNHPSPNSGCPESAAAGALGVRLGGQSSYFGKPSVKPYIGDPARELDAGTIRDAVMLMYWTAAVSTAAFAVISSLLRR